MEENSDKPTVGFKCNVFFMLRSVFHVVHFSCCATFFVLHRLFHLVQPFFMLCTIFHVTRFFFVVIFPVTQYFSYRQPKKGTIKGGENYKI